MALDWETDCIELAFGALWVTAVVAGGDGEYMHNNGDGKGDGLTGRAAHDQSVGRCVTRWGMELHAIARDGVPCVML